MRILLLLRIKGRIVRCLIGKNNYIGLCYIIDNYLSDTYYARYKSSDREGQVRAEEDLSWFRKLNYIFKDKNV